ncbi:hypothetical protein RB195_004995 [Necator americanus]|uniref:Uncharacterized protein n=1 Tax=Necator americanus TaxID=51031 RepID=A0ABR1BKQ0_NECAM
MIRWIQNRNNCKQDDLKLSFFAQPDTQTTCKYPLCATHNKKKRKRQNSNGRWSSFACFNPTSLVGAGESVRETKTINKPLRFYICHVWTLDVLQKITGN